MSDATLKKLLADITDMENLCKLDVNEIPKEVRPGMGSRIQAAKNDLPKAIHQYKMAAQAKTLFICLEGDIDLQTTFADLAQAEAETFTVDASEIYVKILDTLMPTLKNNNFTQMEDSYLFVALEHAMRSIGALSIKRPHLPNFTVTSYPEDHRHIREAIEKVNGGDFTVAAVQFKMLTDAFNIRYNYTTAGCVVLNSNENVYNRLMEQKNASKVLGVAKFNLSGVVDKTTVKKSLNEAKKQLKNN